jgi:hypothetical protein
VHRNKYARAERGTPAQEVALARAREALSLCMGLFSELGSGVAARLQLGV